MGQGNAEPTNSFTQCGGSEKTVSISIVHTNLNPGALRRAEIIAGPLTGMHIPSEGPASF